MNTRSLVALAVTAGALAAPHAAGAADLYVTAGAGVTTCAQDDPCSLEQAITIADIVSNADTIHVTGPLAHTGAVDLSNSPIALIGSGRGAGGTEIDAGADGLRVGAGSSASALSVRSTGDAAVVLEPASAVDHVDVVGALNGIRVDSIAGGEFATIRDSHVVGRIGIVDDSGARRELVPARAHHGRGDRVRGLRPGRHRHDRQQRDPRPDVRGVRRHREQRRGHRHRRQHHRRRRQRRVRRADRRRARREDRPDRLDRARLRHGPVRQHPPHRATG